MGKLYRSNNRVIAGVCAGLAEHFGFNVNMTRLLALVCLIVGGFGGVAYLVLWLLMPVNSNAKSYADRMNERLNGNK